MISFTKEAYHPQFLGFFPIERDRVYHFTVFLVNFGVFFKYLHKLCFPQKIDFQNSNRNYIKNRSFGKKKFSQTNQIPIFLSVKYTKFLVFSYNSSILREIKYLLTKNASSIKILSFKCLLFVYNSTDFLPKIKALLFIRNII